MNRSLARQLPLLGITVLCITLSGCLGKRDWQYPPESTGSYLDVKASKIIPARVVVLPFEDLRGNRVKDEYWKAAIPLVLYGELERDRPEEAEDSEQVDVVRFTPAKDFAEATAAELRESGVFSSVEFAESIDALSSDLVVQGSIRSTNWERRLHTYFLGPFGSLLWIIGIPMGEATTSLELDLRLTPATDLSKAAWSMSMEYQGKKWDSPYYNLEDAVESYPVALQEALKPAIADLVQLADQDPGRLFTPKSPNH